MAIAHRKKKAPEKVRRALLDSAGQIVVEYGFSNLTVQAVASAAGVTKGAFFHHFPNKQSLIDALSTELLLSLDKLIEDFMEGAEEQYGAFTRAYVKAIMNQNGDGHLWTSLSASFVVDPALRKIWTSWLSGRLERHKKTDNDSNLAIVRYAVDGIWLDDLLHGHKRPAAEHLELQQQLIALIDGKTHT
ncbi:TetR/AcrR family transcriptional regulator [Oleidesulfovibrio sp.]|uniref:TetR/AcrR family transcriptional regulator n=1 Tax=Oleidesulfovibrio sp. TaxID=2909707 RepID=UPI003A8C5C54